MRFRRTMPALPNWQRLMQFRHSFGERPAGETAMSEAKL
jgi:hypothetical protein